MGSTNGFTSAEDLPPDGCWRLLRRSHVGRLAVLVDDAPDIFPVNAVADHGGLVFRTAAGTKLTAIKSHPVALEVDGFDATTSQAWSVVVKGTAREVWELDEAIEILLLPLVPWEPGLKPRFVRIEPTSVTGRRFVVAAGVTAPERELPSLLTHSPGGLR